MDILNLFFNFQLYTSLNVSLLLVHRLSTYVAVTGRKQTLFHSKWANLISYISRMLY